MKNINKDQRSLSLRKVYKLLKKIRTKTNRENRNPYKINKKEIKIIMKIIRERNISKN